MAYDRLASDESITKTTAALKEHLVETIIVDTKEAALEKIKESIPEGVSVMNGASRTLEEIGYVAYVKGNEHGWNNLKEAVANEKDPEKQGQLRKQALMADYYLGSAHAITEEGEMLFASASGSQLPHIAYTSPNLIIVAGTQKIVPTREDALARIQEYVFPLEDARMKSTGAAGSILAKILIFVNEAPYMKRNIRLILVKEKLGF